MNKVSQRNFTTPSGHRTGVRLDAATWALVDQAAANARVTWQKWVQQVAAKHDDTTTMTTAVRIAAMEFALSDSIIRQRAAQFERGQHPLFAESAQMSESQLAAHMSECTVQASSESLGGFILHVGFDAAGQTILWIENGLKDAISVALPLNSKLLGNQL